MTQIDVNKLKFNEKISGDGWSYDGLSAITINRGAQVEFVGERVQFAVFNYGTIFGGVFDAPVNNYGTIKGGTFGTSLINSINNHGIIENLIAKPKLKLSGKNAQKITIDESMELPKDLYDHSDKIEVPKNVTVSIGISSSMHITKFTGEGIINVSGIQFYTDGRPVNEPDQITIINDSFRLTKAARSAEKQKAYLENDENDGNSGLDLLASAQNDGEILL